MGNYKPFKHLGTDYSRSFFPYFTKRWNELKLDIKSKNDIEEFKTELKNEVKPKKYKHFQNGSKIANGHLTRLRLNRSLLNSNSFSIGLSDTPFCICNCPDESTSHYLLSCFLYTEERQILFASVSQLITRFTKFSKNKQLNILLN